MKTTVENIKITEAKNQLCLFGYEHYFDLFLRLFQENNLPNTTMLSGPKGLGKSTFAYHFINYLLSLNEKDRYSISNFTINSNNESYKCICNNIHPNFFLLTNSTSDENVKIDQVRNLLKFLSKSTYSNNKKIVLIDNSEYLNISSANALLNSLETPGPNTFFFIIHNSASRILDTIKSRCIKFNFTFSNLHKKKILKNILQNYKLNNSFDDLAESYYFDTPGNLLRYLSIFDNSSIDLSKEKLSCIYYLIEKYQTNNDSNLLTVISFFVEQFYNELSLNNYKNVNNFLINKYKILNYINDAKKILS